MTEKELEKEVIRIMIWGGETACDNAIDGWRSGKYGDSEEMQRLFIAEWTAKRALIRPLAHRMRDEVGS